MATASDRAPGPAGSGLNDDIGEEKRLALYRSQVRLRDAEQRAFDLFLQNLVKGTSHLSIGQEATARQPPRQFCFIIIIVSLWNAGDFTTGSSRQVGLGRNTAKPPSK